jgi:acetylornithine deacetylase
MSEPLDLAKELLARLVAFDTTSHKSNLGLISFVEGYLGGFGIDSRRVPSADGAKASLFATIGPAGIGGIGLSGHTDVVPVTGQAWDTDPFTMVERDGKLYGRGTADMKGFVACCLAAVPDMAGLKRPIHLSFTYDEEVGCIGVRDVIDYLDRKTVKPAGCFVGEPTGMGVIIGHKGKRSYRVTARGRTCHSALAPQGVNAVEYAARLIARIRDTADRLAREGARDPLYDVPYTTAHTGVVHGGTALNIVPDECTFLYEFRSIGADDPDALAAQIEAYARDVLEPEMKAVAPEAGFTFELMSGFPGLDTPEGADLVGLTKDLSRHTGHAKVAYGTEAGRFSFAGIPSVVIGPGFIDQAHKADEYIAASELATCGVFIDRLIAHCRG